MKRIHLTLLISILCCSCNYFSSSETQKRVEQGIAEANSALKQNYQKERSSLKDAYQSLSGKIKDPNLDKKVSSYYSELNITIAYIDSLKAIADKAYTSDEKDDAVNNILTQNDTKSKLFGKIEQSYALATSIAKTSERKLEIQKSKENILFSPDLQKLYDFYFGQDDSLQLQWTLYGFESEIMKIGIDCSKDYAE